MPFHPFDLATVVRADIVRADVLLERIENGHGSRELLVAELVASASLHVAASGAVIVAAVDQHLAPGDDLSAAVVDENRRLADALTVVEESSGLEADAAIAVIHTIVGRHLAENEPPAAKPAAAKPTDDEPADDEPADDEPADRGESALFRQLRNAVGDEGMIALGIEFVSVKRHLPSRPHPTATQPGSTRPGSKTAISRIVTMIDKVKDASSGRAMLAATDGSGILNAESQAVIDALAELGRKPIEILEPEQARRQPAPIDAVNRILEQNDQDILPPFVARVDDTTIATATGDLTVRIYDAAPDQARRKPVVLFVHAGGWVIADIYASDASPRSLALLVDAVVVSVQYRHAPEHHFPAAHDDVLAALKWLHQHADELGGDGQRIALVGEGAGGNMAAAASLGLIRTGQPLPLAQVLINPVTSIRQDWPSYRDNADAVPLNTAMIGWFTGHLLAHRDDVDDRLDLLAAPDADLARMPPTLIITAERDPLHDQGVAFAERLKQLGVAAALRDYDGVPHEFFCMARVLAEARDAHEATAALLISAFAEQP